LTTSLDKARELVHAARAANRRFFVTYTYSGYPMVRLARDMIRAGELGEIRSVAAEYASQYQAELGDPDNWQNDPQRSGPLGIVAGTGTHAFHMAEFVSGLSVGRLSADLASLVPGHRLEDHATMHLQFDNGARGYLYNTTIAIGEENGLCFRIFGSKGGLAWHQERPNQLIFTPLRGQAQVLSRGGFKTSAAADAGTRVSAGHPEGYIEAFANIYTDIADALQSPREDVLAPTVVDGARGVAFMFAALESSQAESRFVSLATV
jgi:predicted dehydrogenase